jgi:hypothetical protein
MRSGKAIVSCLLILFVVGGALQILQVHAADQTAELAYDSGSSSTSWRFKASGVGGYMAVRFTSPYPVSSVLAVKYYIDGKYELATFNVLILDSDRKPVYEKPATPTKAGWFGIDLTGEGIVVTGEFYVAMKWTVPEAPALGADQTNGHGRSIFVFADGSQATYSQQNKGKDGDFMIRALVLNKATSLTLVDLNLSPGEGEHIYVGDTVTATFTLQNSGTATASSVGVKADSPSEVAVLEVTTPKDLAPGSSGTWKLVMRPEKEGEFKIRVGFFIDGVQQSFGGIITADSLTITLSVEVKPVFLVLEQVKTAPSASEPFYVGDVGTITYVLTNGGQMQAGKVEVKVVSSAPEIEIVEVTAPKDLQSGATGEWQVKIKASKPGSYDVYVSFYINGQKQIFETEGQTGTIEQFHSTITASERPFLETYGLYAVVGLVAIVVIVALVVAMRRRGRAAPPPARPAPATSVPPPTVARPPAGKFCEDCGSKMPAGSAFCPKCGARKT